MLNFVEKLFNFEKFREINSHFRTGSVKLSLSARVILVLLKLYLFVMVGLLVVKFYYIFSGGNL